MRAKFWCHLGNVGKYIRTTPMPEIWRRLKADALILPAIPLLASCGMGSHFGVEPKEFRYKPPDYVSQHHKQECKTEAKSAAFRASYEFSQTGETMSYIFGGAGALGSFMAVYEKEEAAYRDAFEQCLKQNNYHVR